MIRRLILDCQRNNRLVWDETLKIMKGLFEDVWGGKDVITVDHCLDFTLPVSFLLCLFAFSLFLIVMPNSDRAVRDRYCWYVPLTQSESRAPS